MREFKRLIGTDNFRGDYNVKISPLTFFDSLQESTEVNMERYGSELAIDYMLAYYKVNIRGFLMVRSPSISLRLPSLFCLFVHTF